MTENPYAPKSSELSPTQERNLAMLGHAVPLGAMVLSAGLLGFVASLVMWVVYKDRGPFVRAHLANSMNIQITTGVFLLVSIPLMLLLIGFVTYPLALVFAFVLHVLGLVKANQGTWFDPPFTMGFVR